jgi:predicted outer membrane lipoprotein
MKERLSVFLRRMAKTMSALTLLMAINLWSSQQLYLLGAVFVGYALAAAFSLSTALRLRRSMELNREAAKRQMLWGLALRLLMLFVGLYVAAQISREVFGATALGFLLAYAAALINLIVINFADKFDF